MQPLETVYYWRDPEMTGIETCRVVKSRHVFPRHTHEGFYAFGLMEQGFSYCLGPERSDSHMAPGQVALINPGQIHSGVPARNLPMTYRMLYIDKTFMQKAAQDVVQRHDTLPEFHPLVVGDQRVAQGIRRVSDLLVGVEDGLAKESAIIEALADMLSRFGGMRVPARPIGPERRAVHLAKAFLSARLDRRVTLEEVAHAVGLSRYHFLRVFKRATGLSPHLFRTQRRIDLARRLLRQGQTLVDVALDTGFADQSHFTHKFKQFTGATPKQYLA